MSTTVFIFSIVNFIVLFLLLSAVGMLRMAQERLTAETKEISETVFLIAKFIAGVARARDAETATPSVEPTPQENKPAEVLPERAEAAPGE